MSLDRTTITNTRAFNNSFDAAAAGADAEQRNEVATFYSGDYSKQFAERNGEAPQNLQAMLEQLDDAAVAMQHTFIAANGNPIGEKFDLLDPDNEIEWLESTFLRLLASRCMHCPAFKASS